MALQIDHTNNTISSPSGVSVSNNNGVNFYAIGYRDIPQNPKSADYTCTLADAGLFIYHPASDANARTFTINGALAYPIGTAISFVNMTSQIVTIAITTDTMYLAGASTSTTGNRSLGIYGSATALKIDTGTWLITGAALT